MLGTALAIPIATALAIVCYAGLAAVVLSKPFRSWLIAATVGAMTPTTHNYAALDAFRGLAALYLAMFHVMQWPADLDGNGFFSGAPWIEAFLLNGRRAVPIAVPVFVVLSGFLIWRSVTAAIERNDLRGYAVNRVLRIAPLYLAATFGTMLLASQSFSWQTIIAEGIGAHMFGHYAMTVPQFWSLYLEMIFYMIAPFVAAVVTKNRAAVFGVLAILFAVSEVMHASRDFSTWKYFLIGMTASEIARDPVRSELAAGIIFAAGAVLVFLNLPPHYAWFEAIADAINPGYQRVVKGFTLSLGVGIAAMMLGAINSRAVGSLLSVTPLRYLAAISYSMFAWHAALIAVNFPVLMTGSGGVALTAPTVPTAAPATAMLLIIVPALVTVSTLSFLTLERPFLLMRRPSPRSLPPLSHAAPRSP